MELDYDYIAKLVRKTQEGDSDAFAELYTATYQSQYRFAYQYVKDPYLAQDIPAGSLHFSIKESGHTEESASLCILVAPDHIPDLF